LYIKKVAQPSAMLEEIVGSVQGHRDGHGFLIRDDGESDI
jgi:ribonuclease R